MLATERLRGQSLPVRTVVVGGKAPANSQQRSSSHEPDVVRFLGSIDDPRPYYAAADIYVQPTFYDPCSLVVLEALASGLPIVTTRFNGAGELITPGLEGHILEEPSDVEALASSIAEFCDLQRRTRAAAAARELALQHTMQHNFREIIEAYQAVHHSRAAA